MAASPVGRRGAAFRMGALPIAALGTVILVVVLAVGTYFYDHSRRDVIANGVRIDGVAVGGLHEAAARTKLERELLVRLNQPVTVRSGSRAWTLGARQAHLSVDVTNMLEQAVSASREGSIVTRTVRWLFGGSVNRNMALVVSYSHRAVRELTAEGARGRQPSGARRDGATERERTRRAYRGRRAWPSTTRSSARASRRRWSAPRPPARYTCPRASSSRP